MAPIGWTGKISPRTQFFFVRPGRPNPLALGPLRLMSGGKKRARAGTDCLGRRFKDLGIPNWPVFGERYTQPLSGRAVEMFAKGGQGLRIGTLGVEGLKEQILQVKASWQDPEAGKT